MFDVTPSDDQKAYAQYLVDNCNFGQRGRLDGRKEQQYVGMLSQVIVVDGLGCARPVIKKEFDGGYDTIINGVLIDVKSMARNVPVRYHFAHNFYEVQINYVAQYFIFCSFNQKSGILTVCGITSKRRFLKLAKHFISGDIRSKDDGSHFEVKDGMYEIAQSELIQVKGFDEIKDRISKYGVLLSLEQVFKDCRIPRGEQQ